MTRLHANNAKSGQRSSLAIHTIARQGSNSAPVMVEHRDAHTSRQSHTSPAKNESPVPMHRGLFACSGLVPSQFFASVPRSHLWGGEQRLLFAVLQDAVACWFRYRSARTLRERRLFTEVVAWFESPASDWLYTFERICEILGLDSNYIRQGLRRCHNTVLVSPTLLSGVRRRDVAKRPSRPT